MQKDALGFRMKEFYENRGKTKLLRRMPVMIRIDGKCFHQFTRGFKKPFDNIMVKTMQDTMKYLCENIQGCVLGYTQSDEITLVLVDYQKLESDAWFDYEVQKVCSVAASMATLAFNSAYQNNIAEMTKDEEEFRHYASKLNKALFDARCFNIPKEEVNNCLLWRQKDAERNSINSCAQAIFSHKELQGLKLGDTKTKLETEKGFIWGNLETTLKRGSCCIKIEDTIELKEEDCYKGNKMTAKVLVETNSGLLIPIYKKTKWIIDNEIPKFNEFPEYVEYLVFVGE